MPRFLVEVPHSSDLHACAEVVEVFLKSGSHFLTNADWGCMDDDHTARIVVDADTKDEARSIVPLAFRADARVVVLNRFSLEQIDKILDCHGGLPQEGQ